MPNRLQAGSTPGTNGPLDDGLRCKKYKEADWRKNQPPRWWLNCTKQFKLKTERAREINVDQVQGITPERDDPLIFVTPTLLGEEKAILAKCAAVVLCCRLLSLVDCCAGRAGQRLQC